MSEVCTTNAPDTSASAALPTCPSWCRLTATEHDFDFDGSTVHRGPSIGLFEGSQGVRADGTPSEDLAVDISAVVDGVDASGLRQLSADALAAAQWLEAQA